MKTIKIMRAAWPDVRAPQWAGRRLRGFFASGREEESLLHNHGGGGRDVYRYPLVQYKIIRGTPTVVALEGGIEQIAPLAATQRELLLGDRRYPCGRIELQHEEAQTGALPELRRYRFCTPWFGLNQANYRRYMSADAVGREALLRRVLVGNLLSLSKGLGITVEERLEPGMLLLAETQMRFKDETVLGFMGEFSVNYAIPALVGLGKSVSRGFGAVEPMGWER